MTPNDYKAIKEKLDEYKKLPLGHIVLAENGQTSFLEAREREYVLSGCCQGLLNDVEKLRGLVFKYGDHNQTCNLRCGSIAGIGCTCDFHKELKALV